LNHGITIDELSELKELFRLVDLDDSGEIEEVELIKLVNLLYGGGMEDSDEQEDFFNELAEMKRKKQASSFTISFSEFILMMNRQPDTSYSSSDVLRSFQMLSRGGKKGTISEEDLAHALLHFDGGMEEKEVDTYMRRLDIDKEGRVDYELMCDMMMGRTPPNTASSTYSI